MFEELVKKTRTYRGFDESRPVGREMLTALVDLTRYTASSANLQPLKYHVASEREEVEQILTMTKWAGALPQLKLPHAGKHPTGFVVICQDMNIGANPTAFLKDVGIVAQTMALAAAEQGVGCCMIGSFSAEGVSEYLRLPESIVPRLVMAFGYPAETVVLTDAGADGKTTYYRDEAGTHYVPKRRLEDILI